MSDLSSLESNLRTIFSMYLQPIFDVEETMDRYEEIFKKQHMKIFAEGFTSDVVAYLHFQLYETRGDKTQAKMLLDLIMKMGFNTPAQVTNLLNNLGACTKQAMIARKLGLLKLVNRSALHLEEDALAEDLLEALIGTLEVVLGKIFREHRQTIYMYGFVEALFTSMGWSFEDKSKKNIMQLLKEYVELKYNADAPLYRCKPTEYVDDNGTLSCTVVYCNKKSETEWSYIALGSAVVRVKNREHFEHAVKDAKMRATEDAISQFNITQEDVDEMRKRRETSQYLQLLVRQIENLLSNAGFIEIEFKYDPKGLAIYMFLRDKYETIEDGYNEDSTKFSVFRMPKEANDTIHKSYEKLYRLIILRYQNMTVDDIRTNVLSVRHNLNMRYIDINSKAPDMICFNKQTTDVTTEDAANIISSRMTADIITPESYNRMASLYRGSNNRGNSTRGNSNRGTYHDRYNNSYRGRGNTNSYTANSNSYRR